ncbi:MAG: GNAT family N-acetyltransferase [Treponema sp.]|nr:GNAT family N-acetyltransferase [Treponema sp.]
MELEPKPRHNGLRIGLNEHIFEKSNKANEMAKLNHMGTKNIETERLLLRKLKIDDVNDVFLIKGDITIHQRQQCQKNIEETILWLKYLQDIYKDNDVYHWGLELKSNNKIIGEIYQVNQLNKYKRFEIAYSINKAYWNNGYATEALCSVIKYLIKTVGYNRIEAKHYMIVQVE